MSYIVLFVLSLIVSSISFAELTTESDTGVGVIEDIPGIDLPVVTEATPEPTDEPEIILSEAAVTESDVQALAYVTDDESTATDTDSEIVLLASDADTEILAQDYSPYLEMILAWQEVIVYVIIACVIIMLITVFSLRWLS